MRVEVGWRKLPPTGLPSADPTYVPVSHDTMRFKPDQ
jgi:hypothetical protein